jgi:hypothetical protein
MEIDQMRTSIGSEKRKQSFDDKSSPKYTVPRSFSKLKAEDLI